MEGINLELNFSYGGSSMEKPTVNDTTFMFIMWGIVLPLVAGVGLVGNTLTMVVLWRREMHSTTILYLRALVVTDTGILIGTVITLTPISCANYLESEALDFFQDWVYPRIHTPAYYLIMALQLGNVWVTMAVSLERYIAICHPFRAARLITRKKTYIVLASIAGIALIYNIPRLIAYDVDPCVTNTLKQFSNLTENHTDFVVTTIPQGVTQNATNPGECIRMKVTETDFYKTSFYIAYRTVMYLAMVYVIPFAALVILNYFLIKELMVMQKRRSGTSIHEENEANLSLVLVLIVIVFIICQTPGLISQFDIMPKGVFHSWLAFSNLMFATNSCVNFLIYTAFGRKFRKVLLRVFRHFYRGTRSQYATSYYGCQTNNDYELPDIPGIHRPSGSSDISGLCPSGNNSKELKTNGHPGETKPLVTSNGNGQCRNGMNGDSKNVEL